MINVSNQGIRLALAVDGRLVWSVGLPTLAAADGTWHTATCWVETSDGHYTCQSAAFDSWFTVEHVGPGCLQCTLRVEFKSCLPIEHMTLPLEFLAARLSYLDRCYRWRPVEGADVIDSLTPGYLAGRCGRHSVSMHCQHHGALVWAGPSGSIDLLLDHAALHPRVCYHEDHLVRRDCCYCPPPQQLETLLSFHVSETPPDSLAGPVLWRYPAGALACLVLTDHADWDNLEILRALYLDQQGFAGTHVRTTKSVFFRTEGYTNPDRRFHPTGLDHPAFSRLADQLHQNGHEICPHSLVPSVPGVPLSREMLLDALDTFARRYASGTWIDHGLSKQPFNYSQVGWDHLDNWYLCDLLREHGFNSLWSYYDTSRYPLKSINQLAGPDEAGDYLRAGLQAFLRGRPWATALYLRLAAGCRLDSATSWHLGQIASFLKALLLPGPTVAARRRALHRLARKIPELVRSVRKSHPVDPRVWLFPLLYAERGRPLGQAETEDLVLFTTQLVNNWDGAYAHLDDLIGARGFHIGHTYLCNQRPYTARTWVRDRKGVQVSPAFAEFLRRADDRIVKGEIWNPTMKECSTWYKAWCKLHWVQMGPNRATITNPTEAYLQDLGLLFSHPVQTIRTNSVELTLRRVDPPIYCVDLPPRSSLDLTWIS